MFWKHFLIALATPLGLSAVFNAGFPKRGKNITTKVPEHAVVKTAKGSRSRVQGK
jgi:hypothetical protein